MIKIRGACLALAWLAALSGCGLVGEQSLGAGKRAAWTAEVPSIGEPTAVQATGDVVVVAGDDGVAALDRRDGSALWTYPVIEPGITVAPDAVVVHDSQLGHYDHATVLDLATGTPRFDVEAPTTGLLEALTVTPDALLVHRCTEDCELAALDLTDGKRRWSRPAGEGTRLPSVRREPPTQPADADLQTRVLPPLPTTGRYAVTTTAGRTASTVTLTAIDVRDGKPLGDWQGAPEAELRALLGDHLLEVADECPSAATLTDLRTQKKVWSTEECLVGTVDRIGGVVAVRSHGQPLLIVDVASGKRLWSSETSLVGGDDHRIISYLPPDSLSDESGEFTAVDSDTGRAVWRAASPAKGDSLDPAPARRYGVAGGRLAFHSVEWGHHGEPSVLRVLKTRNGQQLWYATGVALLGLGDDWVAGTAADHSVVKSPAEISYFSG